MKALAMVCTMFALMLGGCMAFAQDYIPVPIGDIFTQATALITTWGGLHWMAKASGAITLILSATKVTALRPYLWEPLGSFKAWAGPLLGLVAGIFANLAGKEFNIAEILAYVTVGGGAMIFHELLDSLKDLPKVGPWIKAIGEIIKAIPVLGAGETKKAA